MIERLSDLREPPVVGRFYLVPVVRDYPYFGRVDIWPVLGPKHEDAEFINYPHHHYHLDARFLTAEQEAWMVRRGRFIAGLEDDDAALIAVVGRSPLNYDGVPLPKGRPKLAPRKCRRLTYGYAYSDRPQIEALRKHYGNPVDAIRLDDGRALCPHRKADLTQFPPDEAGVVVCPLHGLRVCITSFDPASQAGSSASAAVRSLPADAQPSEGLA